MSPEYGAEYVAKISVNPSGNSILLGMGGPQPCAFMGSLVEGSMETLRWWSMTCIFMLRVRGGVAGPPGERGVAPLADAQALLASSLGKSAGARTRGQPSPPALAPTLPLYPPPPCLLNAGGQVAWSEPGWGAAGGSESRNEVPLEAAACLRTVPGEPRGRGDRRNILGIGSAFFGATGATRHMEEILFLLKCWC